MVKIKHTRESIVELEQEREQFKRERDELIKDVAKMRRKVDVLERENERLLNKNNKVIATGIELTKYRANYINLTEHIKDKAKHNPGVSRYIDLVHVIDELERE